ncbi:hypothetical protein [Streptomyces sp. NBC_00448]|uniref:hypothetical protein n=1 Tax=Streptomyces sp. NBC_00448 TaxID=2903652 RepID=UPI002E1FBD90
MKTRERSAAGGGSGRQSVPAPHLNGPGAGRLPVAPRERKPALAALAVLLILVGALGATVMVLRAGNKVSVVEVMDDVAVGDKIPASAMQEVMVADGTGVDYIRWDQREQVISQWRAATNLTKGSVLVRSMISQNSNVLAPGKTLVGLSLKAGQFPSGLANGLTVAAYLVGNDAKSSGDSSGATGGTGGGSTPISDNLIIKDFKMSNSNFGDGGATATVVADAEDAGPLAIASAAGNVSLVLVPSKH